MVGLFARGFKLGARDANVRCGSTTDLQHHAHLRPLLGVKQTLDVRFPVQHDPTMSKPGSGKEPTL
jgi:hypothetical protein